MTWYPEYNVKKHANIPWWLKLIFYFRPMQACIDPAGNVVVCYKVFRNKIYILK